MHMNLCTFNPCNRVERPLSIPVYVPVMSSYWSRAAVRMQLVQIRKAQSRINLVLHIPRPVLDPMRYHFMDWAGNSKIGFRRLVIAPSKWLNLGDPVPVCPDCGKPFRKSQQLSDSVCYVGDCLEVHDADRTMWQ